jgi:hypothetical protein
MKPMGLNFTPFLSYHDIKTDGIDLIEDAYGFSTEFYDVIDFFRQMKPVPGKQLTVRLIDKIRKMD